MKWKKYRKNEGLIEVLKTFKLPLKTKKVFFSSSEWTSS